MKFLCFVFNYLFFFSVLLGQSKKQYLLVIDPGHGGKDPGQLSSHSKYQHEKDLNLALALKLGKYVAEKLNTQVIYTRKKDTHVTLDQRVNIANKNKADFFISIHCNSNPNKKIYGTAVHIHSRVFKTSKQLALEIDKQLHTRAVRRSRGIRDKLHRGMNLQVLQYTDMPGVLVEAGFLSNTEEEKYLNSEYGQDIIASAIFRAFRSFLDLQHADENHATYYKVQIFASKTSQKNNADFSGSLPMRIDEHTRENHAFKYYYSIGREYEYKTARKLLRKAKDAGFKDAFIIKFFNGKRVYKK